MVKNGDHQLKVLLSKNKSSCRNRRNYKTSRIGKLVMTADRSLQASFPKQRKPQSEYYPSYGYIVTLHLTVYSPV